LKKDIQNAVANLKDWQEGLHEGYECAVSDFYTLILTRLSAQKRMDVIQAAKNAVEELHRQNMRNSAELAEQKRQQKSLSEEDLRDLAEQIDITSDQVQHLDAMLHIFTEEEFSRL